MNKINAFVRRIKKDVQDFVTAAIKEEGIKDLATSHADVLLEVLLADGSISMIELVKLTSRDKSTITVLVQRLIENGYVTKTRSEGDRRVFKILPTSKAIKVCAFIFKIYDEAEIHATRHLTKQEDLELFCLSTCDENTRNIYKY